MFETTDPIYFIFLCLNGYLFIWLVWFLSDYLKKQILSCKLNFSPGLASKNAVSKPLTSQPIALFMTQICFQSPLGGYKEIREYPIDCLGES